MLHHLLHYLRDQILREWLIAFFPGFIAIWFFLKSIPAILRARVSNDWPTARGRVETVTVKTMGDRSLAELGYSYVVEGTRYSGYLSQQFSDEQIAWDAVSSLKVQIVVVRYKLSDPEASVVRAADQPPDFNFKGDGFWISLWRRLRGGILGSAYPRRL